MQETQLTIRTNKAIRQTIRSKEKKQKQPKKKKKVAQYRIAY